MEEDKGKTSRIATGYQTVRSRLGSWLLLQLYRLAWRGELYLARKAMEARWSALGAIGLTIRVRNPGWVLPGQHADHDIIVEHTVRRLCDLPPLEHLAEQAAKHSDAIEEQYVEALQLDDINDLRCDYFLLGAYFNLAVNNAAEAAELTARAKALRPTANTLKHSDVGILERKIARARKAARATLGDRQALKVDISSTNITSVVSLLSTLFLVSGYLYSRFYFGAFGIDVSHFFSLTDYLAVSIEKVRYAAVGGAIALLSVFLGAHHGSQKSPLEAPSEKQRRNEKLTFIAILAFLWVKALLLFMQDDSWWPNSLLLALLLTSLPTSFFLAARFFVQKWLAAFLLMFTTTFAAHLGTSVLADVQKVRLGAPELLRASAFTTNGVQAQLPPNSVLVGTNSSFLFFYDLASHTSIAIPKDSLTAVHVRSKR